MLHLDLNDGWLFSRTEDFAKSEQVRLPHTNTTLPYNYVNENDYQFVSYYKRNLSVTKEWLGKRLLLHFEGVAHCAKVYLNGQFIVQHNCGYTSFCADISQFVVEGDNQLLVEVDSRECQNIPPFGFVIDYLTYGGIYREVFLEICEEYYIEDIFARGFFRSEPYNLVFDVKLNGFKEGLNIRYCVTQGISLLNGNEKMLSDFTQIHSVVNKVKYWSIDQPNTAELEVQLYDGNQHIDTKTVVFGLRTCKFTENGFLLNGEKVKIFGLNRHQSFPYVGYAMPARPQRLDAQILKNELGVNAVRTSHYPQSQHFIDECDKLGLLVFTEIPGWQHIGDESWQQQAVKNTEEMVKQYRNHPSIVLWGVRINESQDCDKLYEQTNQVAHSLDDTRQTAGVRYIKHSHLLEDVYTFNDFVFNGGKTVLTDKKQVTSTKSPYLISEFNGHMFPTKSFDDEAHRVEHAVRHAKVIDAYYADKRICGGFGWCMFDYNTHKDFGSGDKICYHGVTDMFRNLKLAGQVYHSQTDKENVLEITSTLDKGEYPGAFMGAIYAFTNCDSVKLYRNEKFVKEFFPTNSQFKHIPHPTIVIDDLVGDTFAEGEGFSPKSVKHLKQLADYVLSHNMTTVPIRYLGKVLGVLLREKTTVQRLTQIVANSATGWGSQTVTFRFDGIVNGEVVKTVCKRSVNSVNLDVSVDSKELVEGATYDVATVRIKAVDFFGNLVPYYNEAVTLRASGCIDLIGDKVVTLKGGMVGTYVKTTGEKGKGTLTICGVGGDKTVKFNVK